MYSGIIAAAKAAADNDHRPHLEKTNSKDLSEGNGAGNHVNEDGPMFAGKHKRDKSEHSYTESEGDVKAEDLCRINVCGEQYITTFKSLERYPETLLGSPDREKFFCQDLNAYFFNRNRACFESILLFYQTGEDYPPLATDPELYEQEKEFFRIRFNDDLAIEIASNDGLSGICAPGLQSKRKCIHNFLRDPRSSWLATIWHSIDIMFICISISFLVMETDPNIGRHFTDKTEPAYKILYSINTLVIIFFTVDLAVRFVTWPGLLSFWKNIFNILDFLSILPFFVSAIADSMADDGEDSAATNKKYVVLRVCRIFRIVRIFKFVRHSRDLIMIVKVVMHAKKELFLLVILLAIFTITFGAVMYYVEHETNDQFNSIMTGCWWAIVTITTVGYGDISPTTPAGKFVGAVVLTLGIVFLALPMTIIVSKFSSVYEKEKSK